ncbi:MAG: AMP-binding protein [Brevibacterium sp.]|nr:AMP-binding protein [Brevibacterium sp.]MDN5834742.1 AMP-binding protein [Brevibacterium sp.]MDN5877772.1 AMP-binding protein [Brevibacterium sp.]MDN6122830.1 AMP-binding protein [Brevibacterium sp.]MDN6132577.1 AMP-binding protein [Brevibacterium sp.]
MMTVTDEFRAARDNLIELRSDAAAAGEGFEWPHFDHFNFGIDWFDKIAEGNDSPALWIVEQDGTEGKWSYAQLSRRSNQVANFLRRSGVKRGDHVMIMLNNQVELWETMLAGIKLGAVLLPTTTQLGPIDLTDRVERGKAEFVIAGAEDAAKFDDVDAEVVRIVVGDEAKRQQDYSYVDADEEETSFDPQGSSRADDLLLLYFTSGTTSKAKMVAHSHVSYPIGHLSTMYWMGLRPGDVHLNVASPGWAKHAWSNIFTPWIAESCVFLYNYTRFDANALMETMDRVGVTSFCAPPTVWRMLIQADLKHLRTPPKIALGAGEPLNPEVIDRVQQEWGVLIRDGYGQTETTLQVGNSPDQELKYGSMGKVLPGYDVVLIDPATGEEGNEGEICLRLDPRPLGLTSGYWSNEEKTAEAFADGVYHTGDVAERDENGYITYVGRADDVFKASDYRLSPFELESVLIEHEAVAEAAVVPSPDPVRLAVPKAYVVVAGGFEANADTARDILAYCREHLAPYKRIRRLEFSELPKTISGKIRRVELRAREDQLHPFSGEPGVEGKEYADTDFNLKG